MMDFESVRMATIADSMKASAAGHEAFATEYGSKIAAADAAAYRRAAKAVRAEMAEPPAPLEEIRQLLDRCAELADDLTNAESDYRHASRLSRISDGLDLAKERLATCVAAAGGTVEA